MAIFSMTGFGRSSGRSGAWSWAWEIRTVNSKGLDLRLRLPAGFDAIDIEARAAVAAAMQRGACHVNLAATRENAGADIKVNHAALNALIAELADVSLNANVRPASLDGLLALRGIVDNREAEDDETARAALNRDVLAGLKQALDAVLAMRRSEGVAIGAVLAQRVSRIAELAAQAEAAPGRTPEAVKARIARQVDALGQTQGLDPQRLHQEAVLLASRADIREELDRLHAHAKAATELLSKGGPIGRRLDFLAQELGRESNTLCAKSNDAALTAVGLELKVEVEQFREQVQNIE
ncbi:MAG: YicC family protein [Hyphomicrobiales bacterium]|nr:YicC family protein [Hyphomicrobiales bacterium]